MSKEPMDLHSAAAEGRVRANAPDKTETQYAALCWRMSAGKVEVLLITSRDTGRWVIPKGWPIDGLEPHKAAEREAWEEAGATGDIGRESIGAYGYDKVLGPKKKAACAVTVFPLRIRKLEKRFPERNERKRKWFSARKAAKLVNEPDLRALLGDFRPPEADERRPRKAKSASGG